MILSSALAAQDDPASLPLQSRIPAIDCFAHGAGRQAIDAAYRRPEPDCVAFLQAQMRLQEEQARTSSNDDASVDDSRVDNARYRIFDLAQKLVLAVRRERTKASGVDALMQEFSLSSDEGVALMCMAEALLRIPDTATADRLIADKIGRGDWRRHLGKSPSLFVNAAAWGLLITGKLVARRPHDSLGAALGRLLAKGGAPLVRRGVDLAMQLLGNQFVAGQTIDAALTNSHAGSAKGYRYSYDMLGEAALTADDAQRYFDAYREAIHAIGAAAAGAGVRDGPGISVKLSALHPRYNRLQRARVMTELLPRLKILVLLAQHYDIGINIDAEEADRLDLSLDLLEALAADPNLNKFAGLGFVVQAYQKRCPFVIDHIADLARRTGRRFMVRLVKGAYWDSEIKRAQVDGQADYPVYTRKLHTDMSYLVCARKLLANADVLFPQFATHNAQTLASVQVWAEQAGVQEYEFQCLHGMGETLYDQVIGAGGTGGSGARCRIYAPVGPHRTLLAYLVRRLLENGANSSFVNQLVDPAVRLDDLLADPFAAVDMPAGAPHPQIPLPPDLFGADRQNSAGFDFSDEQQLAWLARMRDTFGSRRWQAGAGATGSPVFNPADHTDLVGHVHHAGDDEVAAALIACGTPADSWRQRPPCERTRVLHEAAGLLEEHRAELCMLAVREAGKTWPNAVGEVREAVDFLRFYAAEAERVGRSAAHAPLGTVLCISPWNFPLAIFIGQISAALAAGNAVLAKPAEQTSLMAARAVALLHQAGVPASALHLLPGPGATLGARLVADPRIDAVLFTGSSAVARAIHMQLAARSVAEKRALPLIAETGGQNAMIVDSSALPEQVVQDVMMSAFDSAGQRCSALRVLCLQADIADAVLQLLHGALAESRLGNPSALDIDIGPVIDAAARERLEAHVAAMRAQGMKVTQMPLPTSTQALLARGTYVVPTIIEIDALTRLQHEVFGPVLHVLRYRRDDLDDLIAAINATGFGLTLGVHSRIDETIARVTSQARVGNVYVNRNMIGAVVGVQPFGGEGKSGTGPKAGGPLYLRRLMACKAVTRVDGCGGHDQVGASASRGSDGHGLAPSMPAMPAPPPALQAWLRRHGRAIDLVGAAVESMALSPSPDPPRPGVSTVPTATTGLPPGHLLLPGPTGERNSLWLAPRGSVLCLASSPAMLLRQMEAACASGNHVLLGMSTANLLEPTPTTVLRPVNAVDAAASCTTQADRHDEPWSVVSDAAVGNAACDAVLLDIGLADQWQEAFAAHEGSLLPCVLTDHDQAIDPLRLVIERTLSINTAAAGGNAALMTLSN